jgi:hypothetical protein
METQPPKNRRQFYRQVLFRPVWIAWLVVWFFVSNSDTLLGLIKRKLSPELWRSLEPFLVVTGWPWFVWLIGSLLILLIGAIEKGYQLYASAKRAETVALEKVKEYETPKLALLWIPNESPYRWWDETQKPPALYFGFGVKNISGVTIHGNKVELQKVEPEPSSSYAPCPLRLRHNILPQNEPVLEFSLNAGETRFVQLMLLAENLDFFWILTAIDTIPDWKIPIRPYRFHIRVSSSTPGPEAFGIYELYRDGTLWNMKEIPS